MKKLVISCLGIMVLFVLLSSGTYAATVDVSIINLSFQPQSITVNVGDTVRWTNNDAVSSYYGSIPVPHTTTSGTNNTPDGKWDSGTLSLGQAFSVTFTVPGTYPYFCSIHGFTGTVTVNAPTMPLPTSQQVFVIGPPISAPVFSAIAAQAEPIGIGPVANGGNPLDILIGLDQFQTPVDVYFALAAPAIDPVNIYILTPTGFQTLTAAGLVPWIPGTLGNAAVGLFGSIPTSLLPKGTYTLFLVITPAGSTSTYYLWSTSFAIM